MHQRMTQIAFRSFFYFSLASLLVAPVSAEQRTGSSNDFDHLIPVNDIVDPAYERLLVKKLFGNSRDIVRIIAMTSSASGESAMAIREGMDGSGNMLLTWAQAKRNLWSAAVDTDRKIVRDPAIDIARWQVPVPTAVATAIIERMKRSLQRTGPPAKTERVILDGTLYEISMSPKEMRGPTRALLNDTAHGPEITALRRLIQLLEAYCGAKPAERPEILRRLQTAVGKI